MAYTVLVIDDAAAVRTQVGHVLESLGAEVRLLEAADGLRGFLSLKQHAVDLVLCDVIMPNVDGFKFVRLVREHSAFDDVPIIMLTGEEDVREKVRGLTAGAADYLTKPFNAEELLARVRVHLKVRSLQAELRDKNARLEELIRIDPLTGLKNRRFLLEMLQHEFLRVERYKTPLALAIVDIDHFKKVNDSFGHIVGDRALKGVADALLHTARIQDVVARYGGEEFVVIMPHTDLLGARLAAERHRSYIASISWTEQEGPAQITASFGVVAVPRPDVRDIEALLAQADGALYVAKEAGRNCVEVSRPP